MDEKGDVVSHTFVPIVPDDVRGLAGDPHHTTIREVHVADLGDCIDVCSPILAGQGGYVHVGMDRRPIASAILHRILDMSGVLLLLFLVSALATVVLMRRITRPLRLLTDSAQRLASGETTTTGEKAVLPGWFPTGVGNDEVAQLTRAFRSMALAVSTRETGLKQQFKLLLDSTAEAIYGVDLLGRCIFCNPACVQILGYVKGDDLLGHNMHELIHHTRADGSPYPADECRIYQAFKDGKATHSDDEVLWRTTAPVSPRNTGPTRCAATARPACLADLDRQPVSSSRSSRMPCGTGNFDWGPMSPLLPELVSVESLCQYQRLLVEVVLHL